MSERIPTGWIAATALACLAWGCSPPLATPEQSAEVYRAVAASRVLPAQARDREQAGPGGPVTAAMDRLPGIFEAVPFTHKAHADMAAMSGEGCALCHHHTPSGQPPPACDRCHTAPLDVETAGRLGLKGAAHRQCMDCHVALGASADCTFCHARKGTPRPGSRPPFAPRAALPLKKIYATAHDGGTKVFFDHGNHATECGPCAACHRSEGCATCHGPVEARTPRPADADPHAKCNDCHGKDKDLEFECSDCHSKR